MASPVARATAVLPRLVLGLAVVISTLVLLGTPAVGQDGSSPAESVGGRLAYEGAPVPDVTIVVSSADGAFSAEAVTDSAGEWRVALPGPATYRVELRTDTLPDGVGLRDPDRTSLEIRVFENAASTAIFALGEPEDVGSDLTRRLAQGALNGLKFGLIIGMASVGLSLIFGTTGLVNFAHGDLVTLGALFAYVLNTTAGLHLLVAAPLAILGGAVFAGALDRGLWRPLRARQTGLIAMLVISIGLAFALRHVVLLVLGGTRQVYRDFSTQVALEIGSVRVQPVELWVMGLSVLLLVAVGLMLTRTRIGKSMRAVADNRDLAASSGIDVRRVILAVWVLGGALTAVGGIFLGMIETVDYLMGFRLLLLMFSGVILGGLGSAYGAMFGGVVVGLVSELSTVWFSSELKYMWALTVLILILLVRPQGLLGRRERFG